MRQPREPTTAKEIDTEIMALRRQLSGLPEDAIGERSIIADNIQVLRDRRESLARPWERARPPHERSLCAFGVE